MNLTHKNIELFCWRVLPAGVSVFLFILCVIPKHLWGLNMVMPLLPLAAIFYWGRVQNPEMSYWFACLIGLLTDALSGAPLGLSSLLYLLFLFTLHTQSKYLQKEGFVMQWFYFAALLAGMGFLQWLIMSLLASNLYNIFPALTQFFLTISIYPLLHKFFDTLELKRQDRRWWLTHV